MMSNSQLHSVPILSVIFIVTNQKRTKKERKREEMIYDEAYKKGSIRFLKQ